MEPEDPAVRHRDDEEVTVGREPEATRLCDLAERCQRAVALNSINPIALHVGEVQVSSVPAGAFGVVKLLGHHLNLPIGHVDQITPSRASFWRRASDKPSIPM